jgi:hypothetical protein
MDKQSLVREFLKKGVLVSPSTLQDMEDGKIKKELPSSEAKSSVVLGEKRKGMRCTLRGAGAAAQKGSMTPEDAVRTYRERFEKLRGLLLRKTDAVSVKNAVRENSKVSVIGMVREADTSSFLLEDTTGTIPVRSSVKVLPDDVLSATGWVRDGTLIAESISYPDISISHDVACASGRLLLSFASGPDAGHADVVITPDTLKDAYGEKRLQTPAWAYIEDASGATVSVFIYVHEGSIDQNLALSWLRRRVVGSPGPFVRENTSILDREPDIFWVIGTNEPWTANYKGVTIVSFGKGRQALVDLGTRDISIT